MNKMILLFALFGLSATLGAQQGSALWEDSEAPNRPSAERAIVPKEYRVLRLNAESMLQRLAGAPEEAVVRAGASSHLLELPRPDGGMERFRICASPVMAAGLARRFPQINTYLGKGVEDPTALVRLDYTPHGFHAMVLAGEESYFIDPYYHLLNEGHYLSYFKRDFFSDREVAPCSLKEPSGGGTAGGAPVNAIGEELRIYRLAVATTGEYAQYHGGTVATALAAVVTAVNRVNGVYERDLSVRMILVENNDRIIFTNPSEDPYSGGNQLGVNQTTIDTYIGTANYDIGHYFDRGGGGVAGLGVVCSARDKANGYTGLTPPVGDPFYIDYVAHEMGHQFGGNHTFNGTSGSCGGGNRNGSTAYEPGSGVTIMAYAGICGGDNIAPNSVDHFHNGSLAEMTPYIINGEANSCPVREITGNTPPIVDAGPGGQIIPISTPFELTGFASDLEGDTLTYCWEEVDLGPGGSPNSPLGNAPLFRSFSPSAGPTRIFPRIQNIVSNSLSAGERLPDYGRGLTFRFTARDNHGYGGGVAWDTRTLTVTDQAGPFRVMSQNEPTTWEAGSYQLVEWDVANTNQAPVNATQVNIFLSMDGGYTYPLLLADSLDNNGRALILVPDTLQGSQFRVKVKALGNVFFDINNRDITIRPAAGPGLTLGVPQASLTACGGQALSYEVFIAPLLGLEGEATLSVTGLPEGVVAGFGSPLPLPAQTVVAVSGLESLPTGNYPFLLVAESGTAADTVELNIELFAQAPQGIALSAPAEGEPGVSINAELSWEANPDAAFYQVDVSLTPDFSDIYYTETGIAGDSLVMPVSLPDSALIYWRVRGSNIGCGFGDFTSGFFETEIIRCQIYRPQSLPVLLTEPTSIVISRITVEDDVEVRDVNVRNIRGSHAPLSGLNFRFDSPNGSIIDLLTEDCNGSAFNFSMDDEATSPVTCPINSGRTYIPNDKLASYDGENARGEWRLILFKTAQNGSLEEWELEICFPASTTGSRENVKQARLLELFPNPARDELLVRLPQGAEAGAALFVSNATGQLLLQAGAQPASATATLEVGRLPAGLYFLQAFSIEGRLLGMGKFVKVE